MLRSLHVKNLALIDEIEVEFGEGLNILTGETGAGKSILLGSMQLILGAKTSKNMIRENASYALVELLFQVENEKALETLKALDICPEDGQVLLSRKIMDGRSINKINGETSTVGQMKAAAACLLDIHGQHEHQLLLYQDKQLEILDAYGKEKIVSDICTAVIMHRSGLLTGSSNDIVGLRSHEVDTSIWYQIQNSKGCEIKFYKNGRIDIRFPSAREALDCFVALKLGTIRKS